MLIFPIQKAFEEGRRVVARLDDKVDRAGEALDYAASVPIFKAWSDAQAQATNGLSRGNVREQHMLASSAGRVIAIEFDDVTKTIGFEIDVVDDAAWEKVQKGVYTGISPGGKGRRYIDADGTRRVAMTAVHEMSLVDFPAQQDAIFTVIKAAGAEEIVSFAVHQAAIDPAASLEVAKALASVANVGTAARDAVFIVLTADEVAKACDTRDDHLTSSVERRSMALLGEAMPDGSFPILAQRDLDAAAYVVEKAACEVSSEVRAHLCRRAVEAELVLPTALRDAPTDVRKGMYEVAEFASLISDLRWLATSTAFEAAGENDGSTIPARLAAWLKTGAQLLTDMAGEEAAEAVADLNSLLTSLPTLAAAEAASSDDVIKAMAVARDQAALLIRVTGDLAIARDELGRLAARAEAAQAELTVLKAAPAPGGPSLRNIPRERDGQTGSVDPATAVAAMPDGTTKARAIIRANLTGAIASH